MALVWLLVLVIVVVILYMIDHVKRNAKYEDLKGPSHWLSLPLVGHAYLLGTDVDGTLKKYQKKFGDIFRFDVGNIPTVFLCDFATVQEAYKLEAFTGRSADDSPTFNKLVKQGLRGKEIIYFL